jgi:hypothetical protein
MIYCHPIKKDYFNIKTLEIKTEYFNKKYIKAAKLVNTLLIEISKYEGIKSEKNEILSYKRLIDFKIENYLLKIKIKTF